MSFSNGLPVNFSISPIAKAEIERLRQSAPFPEGSLAVGWSFHWPLVEGDQGLPAIAFYLSDERPKLAPMLETVDGIDLVFFVTAKDHHRFEGRMLDFAPDRGFFVRWRTS